MLLAVARMVQAEECGMSREDGGIGHLWFAHTHFGICLENHATFLSLQEREHWAGRGGIIFCETETINNGPNFDLCSWYEPVLACKCSGLLSRHGPSHGRPQTGHHDQVLWNRNVETDEKICFKSNASWGPLWDSTEVQHFMGPSLGFHGALFGIPWKSSMSWGPLWDSIEIQHVMGPSGIPLKSCMSWGPLWDSIEIQHFMGPSFGFHWSPACHGALFGFPFPADMLKKQGVWGITKQGQRSSCVWFNWKFRRNYLVNSFSWSGVQGCMVFTANWCALGHR